MKIKNKRILVTGGGGSIGAELVRQLSHHNKIFILDNNETATIDLSEELTSQGHWVKPRIGDVRDRETVRDIFEDFKPEYVFHASAYKHVPPMEIYAKEAIDVNVMGTYNVLHEAHKWECLKKFVFISTDKVISSNSIMGATKRLGEIMVKNKGGIVVRFGNVMNSRGSLMTIWQRQHDRGDPLTITDERMERYMMSIPQAVALVIKATEMGTGGEIFVMDMGKKVNINTLAEQILHITGGKKEIIGLRPGETLTEEIMFEEEKKRAILKDNFYIIK